MQSRKEEMREQVKLFHENHPDVWYLFVKFTKEKIDLGFNNYSVNAIFERIRWEKDTGGDGVVSFKLNNNYRAFYSRAFMKKFPQYDGFFRTREQVSEHQSATNMEELGPDYYEQAGS